MPEGNYMPSGVRKFGHKPQPDKGKHHPDDIGPGVETTDKQGGSSQPVPKPSGSKSRIPSGVKRGDGTETRKGTNPHTKQLSVSQPSSSAKNRKPSVERSKDGLTVPKKVK